MCLCPTDSEVKSCMDIDDSSSVEIVDEFCYLGDMLFVDGDVDAAVTARICSDRFKFSHWHLSSLPKMFPCYCKEKFMTHVYHHYFEFYRLKFV